MGDLLTGEARVDFVLRDAQGSERAVLEGMTEAIARCRPRIQAEFWPHSVRAFGDEPLEMAGFYGEPGYRASVLGANGPVARDPRRLVEIAEATPGGFCTLILTSE
jgi:hypothetical protein